MKYLYIEKGQGFFSVSGLKEDKQTIDKIRKEDLLNLLNLLVDESAENEFEMDSYDDENLKNPAHKIIYKNIYEKFDALIKKRVQFEDEICDLYRSAIEMVLCQDLVQVKMRFSSS